MNNTDKYNNMPNRFDPLGLLVKALSLKGLYYPGAWIPMLDKTQKIRKAPELYYDGMTPSKSPRMVSEVTGTEIRKISNYGRVYFMPVTIESSLGLLELPAAAISIKGKKNIVETPLTGRRGSVKELISVDDYEITLHGVIMSEDDNYPEEYVRKFRDLYEANEAVKLICAISDLVLQSDDRIVIKSIDYPEVGAVENAQIINLTAVTDSAIDLVID